MKKILILSMSCNKKCYEQEEEIVANTWAATIDGDMKFYFYKAGTNPETVVDGNTIYVKAPDDWNGTTIKTLKTFQYINAAGDYDYIVKTNTSSYINVETLRKFVETLPDADDNVYGTRLIRRNRTKLLYMGGNFLIFPKKVVDFICRETEILPVADDVWLGNVLKKYYETRGLILYEKLKCIPSVEMMDRLEEYDFEKYKDIIIFRLKTNARRISSEIIDNLAFLHTETLKRNKEFVTPQVKAWKKITFNDRQLINYKEGIKIIENDPINGSIIKLPQLRFKKLLNKEPSRGRKIPFRGLE